jgi:hypothetical protein
LRSVGAGTDIGRGLRSNLELVTVLARTLDLVALDDRSAPFDRY